MTKRLDLARDDAGVRLRTLRLRRGLSQVALAELACISPALVSMVENGQRSLRSASHIFALADVLKVSPFYLAEGRDDSARPVRLTPGMVPFPARCDPITLARHEQLARQFTQLAQPRWPCGWGLAAPSGPRAHRESLAADRPARAPCTPSPGHRHGR